LYEKLGVRRTLKLLSKQYPGGIKSAVERRKSLYEESGLDQEAKDVEATFIHELLETARNQNP
jgi:hypothetical protein